MKSKLNPSVFVSVFRNLLSRLIEKRISIFRDVDHEAGYIGDYHHTHTYEHKEKEPRTYHPDSPTNQQYVGWHTSNHYADNANMDPAAVTGTRSRRRIQ